MPIRETRHAAVPNTPEIDRQGPTKGRTEGRSDVLERMRVKLDAAIEAEEWEAVKVIGARMRELQREDVIDLSTERSRRKR